MPVYDTYDSKTTRPVRQQLCRDMRVISATQYSLRDSFDVEMTKCNSDAF